MNSIPLEIIFNIIAHTNVNTVLNLSMTCRYYKHVCTQNGNYIWKSLARKLLDISDEYKTIQQFDQYNGTDFEHWYNLCIFICNLRITANELLYHSCEGHTDIVRYIYILLCDNVYHTEDTSLDEFSVSEDKHSEYYSVYGYDYTDYKDNMEEVTKKCLECACRYGHLNIVKYIHKMCKCHIQGIADASLHGHLNIVGYYIENINNERIIVELSFLLAAYGGHLPIIKYITTHSVSPNIIEEALTKSNDAGHLDVVEYLREWYCIY